LLTGYKSVAKKHYCKQIKNNVLNIKVIVCFCGVCIIGSNYRVKLILLNKYRNYKTKMKTDIAIGALFISGLWGFISGAFIISTVLFAASAMLSNIFLRESLIKPNS